MKWKGNKSPSASQNSLPEAPPLLTRMEEHECRVTSERALGKKG